VAEAFWRKIRSVIPAFRNAADRLALLDEQGIDSALMFPTLASLIEVNFLDLPKVTLELIHAFNRWLLDEWTYNYKDRIFSTPILNPTIPDEAVKKLEFLLDNGARCALLRPGPVAIRRRARRSCQNPIRFWARVQESGILIAMHASDSGYQRYVNDWEGADIGFSAFKPSAFSLASTGGRSDHRHRAAASCWCVPESS
jgi:hypothetical protein